MKKILALLLVSALAVSMAACDKTDAPVEGDTTTAPAAEGGDETVAPAADAADEGAVLNIYAWNDEFQTRVTDYYTAPEGVTVNWVINPNTDGVYQQKLDEALLAQADAAADDKVDVFLIEADYALKYVNSDFSAAVYDDLGLTEADTANMYQYTKDICTDTTTGQLKGVSWQGAPAGIIYRRSIAEDVIGSSDPAAVQDALSDWTKYNDVAAKAVEKGYLMTSSFAADFRVFSNNMSGPWVVDGEIQIQPEIDAWIDQTKNLYDTGATTGYGIWDAESFAQAKADGKAMCYFGPAWFLDFCLVAPATEDEANSSMGDWGVVTGPQGYFWGGTWLCGAAGTDNPAAVKDLMLKMTCDKDTLLKITNDKGDFTNDKNVMNEVAASDYSHEFLGGQNHIGAFVASADSIDMSNSTMYDFALTEGIQTAFKDYFLGTIDKETAMANFYKLAIEAYPELVAPAQ